MTAPQTAPIHPLMLGGHGSDSLAGYAPGFSLPPSYATNGIPYLTTPTPGTATLPLASGAPTDLSALGSNPTVSAALRKLLNGGATGQGQGAGLYGSFPAFGGFGGFDNGGGY
jgi:hypothetical protein